MSELTTNTQSVRERNALWHRYSELGKLDPWVKQKVYDELKLHGVEQRFLKTAIYEGFELHKMHRDLRDVLINNGLLTQAEWWADKFLMDFEQWFEFYKNFEVKVQPLASREPGKINRKRVKTA